MMRTQERRDRTWLLIVPLGASVLPWLITFFSHRGADNLVPETTFVIEGFAPLAGWLVVVAYGLATRRAWQTWPLLPFAAASVAFLVLAQVIVAHYSRFDELDRSTTWWSDVTTGFAVLALLQPILALAGGLFITLSRPRP